MATAMSSTRHDDTASSIRDLITCSICNRKELTSALKTLPCFYNACTNCLEGNITCLPGRKEYKCPCCAKNHPMPERIETDLEDNIFTVNMKCLSDIFSNDPPKCKACQMAGEETASSTFCLLCRNHFCQSDGPRHMATPGHDVISHSELQSEQVIPKILSTYSERCENSDIHEDPQPFKHYCIQCQILSCGECLTYNHEGHKKMPLKQAGEKQSGQLKEKVESLKKIRAGKKEGMKILQQNMSKTKENKKKTAEEILSFGEKVKEMVDKLVKEKIHGLDIEEKIEEEKIDKAIAEMKKDETRLRVATDHVETFLVYSSHINVLSKCKSFHTNLEECEQRVTKSSLVPVKKFPFKHEELSEVKRSLTKAFLGKELQDFEFIATTDDGHYQDVAVYHDDIIAVGGTEVYVFGMSGEKKEQIKCQGLRDGVALAVHEDMMYIADQEKKEVAAFDMRGNRKKCVQLPGKGGTLYDLTLDPIDSNIYITCQDPDTINRCSVALPQFQPFVTQGLSQPHYIAVVPKKGIVVSNQGSNEIHMYSFRGTLLWKYRGEKEKEIKGVCVDHLDHIFLAEVSTDSFTFFFHYNKCKLHYITPGGQLLKNFTLETYPLALAIKNDWLVILSRKSTSVWVSLVSNDCYIRTIKCNYL